MNLSRLLSETFFLLNTKGEPSESTVFYKVDGKLAVIAILRNDLSESFGRDVLKLKESERPQAGDVIVNPGPTTKLLVKKVDFDLALGMMGPEEEKEWSWWNRVYARFPDEESEEEAKAA